MTDLSKYTEEQLINMLPQTMYNCEAFGLAMMIDGDRMRWHVTYYSCFSKKRNEAIPSFCEVGFRRTLEAAFHWFEENASNYINWGV